MLKVALFSAFLGSVLMTFSVSGQSLQQRPQRVLHLQGSPYEMGYQHGQALKKEVAQNIHDFIDSQVLANPTHPQIQPFLESLPSILSYVPEAYKQEMKGLAEGAQVPYDKVLLLNLFPEMFHCSGITVSGPATKRDELYHVRVLDYSVGKNLQNTAVLMVVEPTGKIPFLNVSYAGFIGCITGMNRQHIALGEIGGKGYGHYQGMPMAFLLRHILEEASTLQAVKDLLAATPRSCEYYYVFSDGKTKQSCGVYATGTQLRFIEPGSSYALFEREKPDAWPTTYDKLVLNDGQVESSHYQTVLYQDPEKQHQWGLIHQQPPHCLVMTGFPHPQRYPVLVQRLLDCYGRIDAKNLQQVIKQPVALPANLHNAIFAPATLDVWIAHAGPQGEPACDEFYEHYNLKELMQQKTSAE